jgi:hypothetical protein
MQVEDADEEQQGNDRRSPGLYTIERRLGALEPLTTISRLHSYSARSRQLSIVLHIRNDYQVSRMCNFHINTEEHVVDGLPFEKEKERINAKSGPGPGHKRASLVPCPLSSSTTVHSFRCYAYLRTR